MATPELTVPREVLFAYGLPQHVRVERFDSLINPTFLVTAADGTRAIIQRLHPVFRPEVNLDIEAITRRLMEREVETPRLLRTANGELWVNLPDGTWRAQSFVPGRTIHAVSTAGQARAAGAAVGRFHAALDGFEHRFHFSRSGVHDTAQHLRGLSEALAGGEADDRARSLGADILARGEQLPLTELAALPRRLCHGDLKISNLRFAPDGGDGVVALIDLDTVAHMTLAYELGDALRSWCNPNPEDGPDVGLDIDVFQSALRGFAAEAGQVVGADEFGAVVPGLAAVSLELASRFCRDAVEDRYFGWDPTRFSSRADHNLARARTQWELAGRVLDARGTLEEIAGEVANRA